MTLRSNQISRRRTTEYLQPIAAIDLQALSAACLLTSDGGVPRVAVAHAGEHHVVGMVRRVSREVVVLPVDLGLVVIVHALDVREALHAANMRPPRVLIRRALRNLLQESWRWRDYETW